ncbi:MAG: hypothetical protein JMN27_18000 [gamma proteobacterium endosymbiont of Lamellibrachia anaximandri]|nr:hypothetical protein [gamma proteobacterium endosymbiont of Lamellibrachia anaximandri]MBL3535699.1 hypothetical protein [gamma proteobacterium endosymbiont of Lamellibrachia anaximandri]MBL3600679.1 hypothetical protein [gamma proteobacterium endosymbiont of Lamellibrachia anaximandri]
MMKKKEKKKLKKKDKIRVAGTVENQAGTRDLKKRIKQLEAELKHCNETIEALRHQVKDKQTGKNKKRKPGNSAVKSLRSQQSTTVAVAQRSAWKRHRYLRDRYDFHLDNCHDKPDARDLADKDLRQEYGEDAGFSKQELDHILS